MDLNALTIEEKDEQKSIDEEELKFEKFRKREIRKEFYRDVMEGFVDAWKILETEDEDFFKTRKKYCKEYMIEYDIGFDHYIAGNWRMAKKHFEKAEVMISF